MENEEHLDEELSYTFKEKFVLTMGSALVAVIAEQLAKKGLKALVLARRTR